jgi:hypothetical protein
MRLRLNVRPGFPPALALAGRGGGGRGCLLVRVYAPPAQKVSGEKSRAERHRTSHHFPFSSRAKEMGVQIPICRLHRALQLRTLVGVVAMNQTACRIAYSHLYTLV